MAKNTVTRYRELIEFYGRQEDVVAKNLLRALSIIPDDEEIMLLLEEYVQNHPATKRKQVTGNPFPTPPPPKKQEESDGILLGTDENENPFFLAAKNLVKILLIMGGIGFGKTTAVINILFQLTKKGILWMAMDYKRDYRRIAKETNAVVLRFSQTPNFKWNPLQQIPGTQTLEQDTSFANTLAETCFLREGSTSVIVEKIQKLRTQKKECPTIKDLHDEISALPNKYGREGEWKASSLRALRSLLLSFGEMIGCEQGIDIIDVIRNHNVILELDNAGDFKSFFSTLVANYYLTWKKNNNIRGKEIPIHVNVCDEGVFLFGKNLQKSSPTESLSIISHIQTGREFGEAWIATTNEPSNMIDTIKNNAATKILLRMGDWKNVLDANNSMANTKEQADQTISLRPGEAIAQKEGLKSHKITLTNVPLPEPYPSDEEIEKMSEPIINRYTVITITQAPQKEELQKKEEKPQLLPEEKAFLKDIAQNVTATKTQHYKNAGLSPDKGDRTFKKILKKSLVGEITVNLGGNKKQAKILYLTPDGYAAICQKPTHQSTRGESAEHCFWTHYYNEQLQKSGYKTKISYSIRGKEVDIGVIQKDGLFTAIEICITTTAEHEAQQIQKNLQAEYSHVITLTKEKTKAEKIFSLLKEQGISPEKFFVSPLVPDVTQILKERGCQQCLDS